MGRIWHDRLHRNGQRKRLNALPLASVVGSTRGRVVTRRRAVVVDAQRLPLQQRPPCKRTARRAAVGVGVTVVAALDATARARCSRTSSRSSRTRFAAGAMTRRKRWRRIPVVAVGVGAQLRSGAARARVGVAQQSSRRTLAAVTVAVARPGVAATTAATPPS